MVYFCALERNMTDYKKVSMRGTWRHPKYKKWYEIGQMRATPEVSKFVHHVRTITTHFTEHRAKLYQMCFYDGVGKSKRKTRKEWFKKVDCLKNAKLEEKAPLMYSKIRGSTKSSLENRVWLAEVTEANTMEWLQKEAFWRTPRTVRAWYNMKVLSL